MREITEKANLVHWYYSVAEWEAFMRVEDKKRGTSILIPGLLVWVMGLFFIRFSRHMTWMPSIAISSIIVAVFVLGKNYIRQLTMKWKGQQVPEVQISDSMAILNDKPVVFRSREKLLRKVDLKEYKTINVLEITYEWETRSGLNFNELRIPIPKGKLREAMEVQNSLNLRLQ